ncbi:MAG: alpha-amylase family glycosyl hydrolase [Candidatus Shapirobacteria bacterium]|jgi:hypothetical protein|nr:alpha-amylase family glycosyl hydrolase [Candidatus Shapirobacteria bacterium]
MTSETATRAPQTETLQKNIEIQLELLNSVESEKQLRSIYLINTRLWLDDLSKKYQTRITIGGVPQEEWKKLFERHDNFWFMGIYKPSQIGQECAKQYVEQYRGYLPDIDKDKDVVASPFAVAGYCLNPLIAKDWQEWDQMVEMLNQKNKKIFIDFVPNHTAIDHPWVESHPEYYIQGNEQLYFSTNNFLQIKNKQGEIKYFAYGKDPNFGPWIDTLQLNYSNLELQKTMRQEIEQLSQHADGFRCDMAMLINPETFLRSWGWCLNEEEKKRVEENPFWQKTIPEIKKKAILDNKRNIEFIAEAYWEEVELGKYFDYIYNHDLYKKLKTSIKTGSIDDLKGYINYLINNPNGLGNFWAVYTENHDEDRAVRTMGKLSKAATTITALIGNSMFLLNQGQEEGFSFRPPMQVARFKDENVDQNMAKFYDDLLKIRRSTLFQEGKIKIIDSTNGDNNSIIFEISDSKTKSRAIVAINMTQLTTFAQINKGENYLSVYNLTNGSKSNDDEATDQKLTLKLNPGEVKIACLNQICEVYCSKSDYALTEIVSRVS